MKHLETFRQSISPSAAQSDSEAGATFAIATRDNPDVAEVTARVREVLRGADVHVSPIFDSKDEGLSRHFAVRVPGGVLDRAAADRLDLGYELQDALQLASVDVLRNAQVGEAPEAYGVTASSSPSSSPGDGPATEPEWHLASIRAEAAWATTRGRGILVGQPDTGVADHHLLTDSVSRRHTCNMLEQGRLPIDPLRKPDSTWNPGHGTSTASVASSRGNDADRRIRGVAPEAAVLPVRCVESVILADWTAMKLADAIYRAADEGAQVISMSLGGVLPLTWAFVHAAIKYGAEKKGIVFVAAAGNGVGNIGGPATYPGIDYYCACIAGSTVTDTGWGGSLGGPAVTVSAPAEKVWSAWREPGDNPQTATRRVGAGSGTSYATAIVGGIAALWIAHHGHENLIRRFGGWRVTKEFQRLLRATARVPSGWSSGYYGAGIANAEALLRASLDEGAPAATTLDSPEAELRQHVRNQLAAAGADAAAVSRLDDALLDRYGRELTAHAARAAHRHATGATPAGVWALSAALQGALAKANAAAIASSLTA